MIVYKDTRRPIEELVKDLLNRMTLEENVGQMCQMNGNEEPEKWLNEQHVGSFLHVLALVNQNLETVVEPGEFEVMVGGSSRDQGLLKGTFEAKA